MIVQWTPDILSKLPANTVDRINAALEYGYGERDVIDVAKDLAAGTKQIWVHSTEDDLDFIIVTQVVEHPKKKICEIVYSGGSGMLKALDELEVIEDWARMNNCTDIHAIGRDYLSRSLRKYGYDKRYITVGKAL